MKTDPLITKAAKRIGSTDVDPDASEQDPTKINGLIRQILNCFSQSAYVGYTATPYANILINPDVKNETFGKDLFPENFIIVLPTPKDYCGIEKFFGTRENTNYDLVETIDDDSDFFDDKNNELKKNVEVDYKNGELKVLILTDLKKVQNHLKNL